MVSITKLGGQDFFKISFVGQFNNEQVNNILNSLKAHGIENREKISMVWDCQQMSGYDNNARDQWQNFFEGIKSKIGVVHLVSDNIAYRAAGRAFGIYWRVKISVWEDYSQLEEGLS